MNSEDKEPSRWAVACTNLQDIAMALRAHIQAGTLNVDYINSQLYPIAVMTLEVKPDNINASQHDFSIRGVGSNQNPVTAIPQAEQIDDPMEEATQSPESTKWVALKYQSQSNRTTPFQEPSISSKSKLPMPNNGQYRTPERDQSEDSSPYAQVDVHQMSTVDDHGDDIIVHSFSTDKGLPSPTPTTDLKFTPKRSKSKRKFRFQSTSRQTRKRQPKVQMTPNTLITPDVNNESSEDDEDDDVLIIDDGGSATRSQTKNARQMVNFLYNRPDHR